MYAVVSRRTIEVFRMSDAARSLVAVFRHMAQLLESERANPHRVRAYRRAADALAQWEEDLVATAARGALKTIPGIGRELSAKIEEFLKTGTIQSYEALKRPLPQEIADWATLPGLSEAAVHQLYHRLGIRTLDDLEQLVRSHLLRTLPGVTGSEETLLEAIRARRDRS
jgi:DNA polymerase (family 10)